MPATNTLLTVDKITTAALALLHEKTQFIRGVNREYDGQFAQTGAKIGDTLRIRKKARYTVRTGRVASVQNSVDQSTALTVATQKGVDMDFNSADLALKIDEFSDRYIEPAMSALVADMESDCLQRAVIATPNSIYSAVPGTPPAALSTYLQARERMNVGLAPKDSRRTMLINSPSSTQIVDTLKGLFNSTTQIKEQYEEGMMGRTAGYNWKESEYLPSRTNASKVAALTVSAPPTDGSNQLIIAGTAAADAFRAGSVFTIAGVFAVHPETKMQFAFLQQFTVTSTVISAGATTTLTVFPAFQFASPSAAHKNISALPAAAAALVFVGAAGATITSNLAYHQDAFTFATADLPVPSGMDMAGRKVFEGVSLRFVRGYDIQQDVFVSRLDVLYGFAPIYPEWACRVEY